MINHNDIALLVTRILIGGIWLIHGIRKFEDITALQEGFAMMGFPGTLGVVVGVVEVVGGLLLLFGIFTRAATIPLVGIIVVAIGTVQIQHLQDIFLGLHAGLERDLLILASTVGIMSFGPGKYSVDAEYPQLQLVPKLVERTA